MTSRWILRGYWAIHQWLWRVSGHRLGTSGPARGRVGTLFLLTTGRRTGTVRRNGLYFVEDGPDLVVVASNAGDAADPQWWLNLQATPAANVERGRGTVLVRGRLAAPEERARLWPKLLAAYPAYAIYAAAVEREIPVVILEPR